jgi:hypothetical protein
MLDVENSREARKIIRENEYTEHLIKSSKFKYSKVLNKLKLMLVNSSIFFYLNGLLNKKKYGSIKFVQADFTNLSFIQSNSVDAIVSTSAVEHNPSHESLKKGEVKDVKTLSQSAINDISFFESIKSSVGLNTTL